MALLPLWILAAFQFLNPYAVGKTHRMGDRPIARPLPTHRIQNKSTQTSIPRVGFEPTIPVFERAKTIHALDGVTAVIGSNGDYTN
jgi:hypothetical protein